MDQNMTLEKRIAAELYSYQGKMSVFVDDLRGSTVEIGADEEFETASTIKAFILAVLYLQASRAVHVRDLQNGAGGLQHEHICHGGLPGGVQLVGQLVQQTVVFQQILVDSGSGGNLVGQAPHGDAGVVVVLTDQLLHLGQGATP